MISTRDRRQAIALIDEAVAAGARPLVLHADNGSPQTGSLLTATLDRLGVNSSYSRPRVSDANAFAETLFRTLKYRPAYPVDGFDVQPDVLVQQLGYRVSYHCSRPRLTSGRHAHSPHTRLYPELSRSADQPGPPPRLVGLTRSLASVYLPYR
jgi:transposase InsO family protein